MAADKLQKSIDNIASECIAVRLRILNRTVTSVYDDALRPLGLRVSQMNILVAAGKLGLARPADVASRLHMDVSTLSRNVERMKSRGWLETVPDEDGRAQPFQLTKDGRRMLQKAIPAWKKAQRATKELLGEDTISQIAAAVKRLPAAAS